MSLEQVSSILKAERITNLQCHLEWHKKVEAPNVNTLFALILQVFHHSTEVNIIWKQQPLWNFEVSGILF